MLQGIKHQLKQTYTHQSIHNSRLNMDQIPDYFQEFLVMKYYDLCGKLPVTGFLLSNFHITEDIKLTNHRNPPEYVPMFSITYRNHSN